MGPEPRVETHLQPERDCGGERDGRKVVAGELVVSGGDTAEVLEAAEHCLDAPAVFVAAFVVLDWPLAVAPAGDDGDRTLVAQSGPESVGVVAAIGDQPLHAGGLADEQVGTLDVARVARRQDEAQGSAEEVDKGMDLRRPTAARDANGLGASPPFAPPEQRCALT